MKIAYLAPEIPALSATFVYKEILKLKDFGTEVIPFSVHYPSSVANEAGLNELKKQVVHLYEQSKLSVLFAHIYLLLSHPLRYLTSLRLLISDMLTIGFCSRNAFGLVFRFFYAGSLAKELIQTKCQHIHVHFAHVPTDIAMYAASLSNIEFSVTAHANDLFERGWLLKQKVERSAFFATISEFNKRYLADIGISTENIRIVRCGVDDEQFEPRRNFISGSKIKVGVVGRLVEKKGIDTLINAVSKLKNQGQLIELSIAGSGPLENELMEQVKECNLTADDVIFLGAIPNSDVSDFITSLDVFVLPCKMDKSGDMDGIPVVLMEAMLSGVPVISTKLSGLPELVIDKHTGLMVAPNNDADLANAILDMINDSNQRNMMILNAVDKVKKEFSLRGNTERLNDMFRNVVVNKFGSKED